MRCARSPPSQPRAEGRQMAKQPSLAHALCELSHLCSGVSSGGCRLGWAGGGQGKSGGGLCLAAFTFKSPEPGVPTPFPGSEPERGKQRVFIQADWTARRPPPPPAGSLPPVSESISHGLPLVPQKLQLVGWGEDFSGDILPASRSPGRSDFPRETGIRLPRSRK